MLRPWDCQQFVNIDNATNKDRTAARDRRQRRGGEARDNARTRTLLSTSPSRHIVTLELHKSVTHCDTGATEVCHQPRHIVTLELHKSVTNPDTEQRQAVHLSGGPLITEHLTLATFFSIDWCSLEFVWSITGSLSLSSGVLFETIFFIILLKYN